MTAKVIPFPITPPAQPQYKLVEFRSIDLLHCWSKQFFNPYLNRLYRDNVSYVQRWYFEVSHCFNIENPTAVSKQLIYDHDFRESLIRACDLDMSRCQYYSQYEEYEPAALYWMPKLKRWKGKFVACRSLAA